MLAGRDDPHVPDDWPARHGRAQRVRPTNRRSEVQNIASSMLMLITLPPPSDSETLFMSGEILNVWKKYISSRVS